MEKIWDTLVRWRTWAVNLVLILITLAPEILSAPEVLAVVPAEWQRWFLAALFVLNIWMRPRPASRANDVDVQVKNAVKEADGPALVVVEAGGETKVMNA